MRFIDFFAGIGGFRLGMEMAGHECVGHCEIDKYANKSYIAIHNPKEDEWFAEDITKVRADNLPRADCWCFGFPCQDISVAGKQTGFRGSRSSLFFRVTGLVADLKEEDKPSVLFIENVKNLLSVNGGWDFAKLLIELDEIGYDAEWQVLNSKDFGVPQNRERVFIIGHLRGRSGGEIFPIGGTDKATDVPIKIVAHRNGYRRNTQVFAPEGITETLDTGQGGGRGHHVLCVGNVNPSGNGMNGNVFSSKGLSPTLTTNKGEGNKIAVPNWIPTPDDINRTLRTGGKGSLTAKHNYDHVAIPVLTPDRAEKRQNGRRFKEDGEPMFTLTAQDRHGVAIIDGMYANREPREYTDNAPTLRADRHGLMVKEATKKGFAIEEEGDSINLEQPNSKTRRGRVGKGVAQTLTTSPQQATLQGFRIRKLTPKECFRLQGFPDKYFERAEAVNSNSQLYKQAGNSVTVNVVYEIARRL